MQGGVGGNSLGFPSISFLDDESHLQHRGVHRLLRIIGTSLIVKGDHLHWNAASVFLIHIIFITTTSYRPTPLRHLRHRWLVLWCTCVRPSTSIPEESRGANTEEGYLQ